MAYDGKEGAPIEPETAAAWTANYRASCPEEIRARFFGRDIIEAILAQEGCVGIRIYYALSDTGEKQLILSGADEDEKDIIGILADFSSPCPYNCDSTSDLNAIPPPPVGQ